MAQITYELWLDDQYGNRITQLAGYSQLQWTRTINGRGSFMLTLPASAFDRRLYDLDRRVEIWRYAEESPPELVTVGLLRYMKRWMAGENKFIAIGGWDPNDLLARRITSFRAGDSESQKSGPADDVMKAFVRQCLLPGNYRDIPQFTCQDDVSWGSTISITSAMRNLLSVLQDIAQAATNMGAVTGSPDVTAFDMVPVGNDFQFRTYVGTRGVNRAGPPAYYLPSQAAPLILSAELGTLADPSLEEDARDEYNYLYVGGNGIEQNRRMLPYPDTTRTSRSIFNLRERFYSATRNYSNDGLQLIADQQLRAGRPRRSFTARIIDSDFNRFGRDWGFGDRVLAAFDEEQFPCNISTVVGTFSQGFERIDARLDYVGQ